MKGAVHSIETFGSVDGPGVRFVIFLQGCAMRCRYCHNPDTWQIREPDTEPEELLKKALRYRPYWKNGGGITVSGGEPLLQMEFVTELFSLAKKKGVHTALDTSGQPYRTDPEWQDQFNKLMAVTDLVLLDLKQLDSGKHKNLTGHCNGNILELARDLSRRGKPVWIRHVLVPGLTDDPDGWQALKDFLEPMDNVEKVEVLPYHSFGVYKYKELGIPYTLEDTLPPDAGTLQKAKEILERPSS